MADNEKTTSATSGAEGRQNRNNNRRNNRHHGHHGPRPDRRENAEIAAEAAEALGGASVPAAQSSHTGGNGQNRHQHNGNRRGDNRKPKQEGSDNARNSQGNSQKQNQRQDRNGHKDRRDDRHDNRQPAARPETAEFTEIPESLRTESFFEAPKNDFLFDSVQKDDSWIDSMPTDPTLDEVFGEPKPVKPRTDGTEIVGIHFPQGGKVYYFSPANYVFEKGQFAIVETARGQELGEIAIANTRVADSDIVQPLKSVIRPANDSDIEHAKANAAKEAEALEICKKKVLDHKLDMKLTGAQYTFDNAKLIFYFTAAQRVDFRELVKDLASTFRTRIELRQIGPRDEAKMIGGRGACGRKLCCSVFLPNYAQSTIKMAKHQGLALNSAKISGICGKLMCCLKYEDSTYSKELALMPTVNSTVETPDGRGFVTDVRPVGYLVKVKLNDKPDAAPKQYRLCDIKVLERAAEQIDDADDKSDEKDDDN